MSSGIISKLVFIQIFWYMKCSRFSVIFIALIHFCASAFTQNAGVSFHNINDLFGISIRETSSVRTDNNGFVWVSSKTGILRLTDDDYRVYKLPYQTSDVINVRLVFSESTLYAVSNNGQVFRYNEVFDRFDFLIHLGVSLNFTYLYIANVIVEPNGKLWFSTNIGLLYYEEENAYGLIETGELSAITFLDESRLLVASMDKLMIYNIKTEQQEAVLFDFPVRSFRISTLFFDKALQTLLIGTESDGLFVYNLQTKERVYFKGIPHQPILAISQASDSTIYLGVDGQGLWEVSLEQLSVINNFKEDADNPNSLRGNGVYDIFSTQGDRVWICTYSGGVSYFDKTPTLITHYMHIPNNPNSLVNNDVNDVLEDSRGNLWFATNNGLSRLYTKTEKWTTLYHNEFEQAQVFLSLIEDSKGNIWAGTYSSGVYVIDGRSGRELYHFPNPGYQFNNPFVFDLKQDSSGNIWIVGVRGEVFMFDQTTRQFKSYGMHPVIVIDELSPQEMLLGCSYGLSLLNRESGAVNILITGYLIHDMLLDGDDVWMCTVGEGLVRYNLVTRRVDKFTMDSSGLPSDFVNSIMDDGRYFWLGTENGICRFDPSNFSVETYPSFKGLSRVSYNRNANFKKENGDLAWGTNRGAVVFNPSVLVQKHVDGKMFFQDINVLGQSLRSEVHGELTTPINQIEYLKLTHVQNTISLEVLPLGMPYGAKFSWLLEGLDTEWSQPANTRILNYTNLTTGQYVLRIRMYDNSMLNIVDERSITINKLPPFWETWWFLLIVTTFLLSGFYLSLKYYISLIRELHSQEKIRFFAGTAHDMRTSLTLIKAPIDELSDESGLTESGRYYLGLAQNQVERLNAVVTRLMDFQKADIGKEQLVLNKVNLVELVSNRLLIYDSIAANHQIDLRFKDLCGELYLGVDEAMIEKVVDNLLSNAIKYSKNGSVVDVVLSADANSWKFEVKDSGIGISKSAQKQLFKEFYRGDNAINSKVVGSGIGLLLAKKYITLHGGTIEYTSQLNVGTTFTVEVPIDGDFLAGLPDDGVNQARDEVRDVAAGLVSSNVLPTVLVVEDNEELRRFLNQSLFYDFQVLTAKDGSEAWEIINDKLPDLVVSDVMMPNMSGFELCKLIKSTYETSHIPVILLTALSEETDQMHGLGLGADDYLTKPFNTTLLKQRIKSIIANRDVVRDKALNIKRGSEGDRILANVLNDDFLKKALEVVHENLSNHEFNKDSFASEMNVSASLLYKKLKSITNQSPTDFIKSIRLNYAVELLQTKDYTVTEVGEMSGFSSIGYFSTVFKKHYGFPPSDLLEG